MFKRIKKTIKKYFLRHYEFLSWLVLVAFWLDRLWAFISEPTDTQALVLGFTIVIYFALFGVTVNLRR